MKKDSEQMVFLSGRKLKKKIEKSPSATKREFLKLEISFKSQRFF